MQATGERDNLPPPDVTRDRAHRDLGDGVDGATVKPELKTFVQASIHHDHLWMLPGSPHRCDGILDLPEEFVGRESVHGFDAARKM